ncbi:hypothetical protein [Phenylobacterium sp.]|uniref:hypothetical protein n=1 Tax=Phenylobacterium sp. TaxID=1871053 RepID=UPI0008D54F92|nr:hypothetical protein [Phenylobacterium sp.]MBA4792157.1 hypothetical protein [Phenylobacterium sp.]MBC7166639.1 hypothetical protein [Phenylobacterium sp.]OHB33013.1 MAG: hypothetical protein A2882_13430 [Phenylobacterium sp. RIFCSPHIGHO2_01_FULL_70_10]
MAKAVFQRNQRVWVESVGAWAVIEKIVPVWARGFDEPVRVTYDVGLGRDFHAHELRGEQSTQDLVNDDEPSWRLLRARNKWQQPEDCEHHPYPGTYPVVVTDAQDWGGWRVPGAEYDRDPLKVEFQARLIASSKRLLSIARHLTAMVDEAPEDAPPEIRRLAEEARKVERYLQQIPAAPEAAPGEAEENAA